VINISVFWDGFVVAYFMIHGYMKDICGLHEMQLPDVTIHNSIRVQDRRINVVIRRFVVRPGIQATGVA
jgi:hypothetical protein